MVEARLTVSAGSDGGRPASLAERMAQVHISRISEMPRIELYLDQIITLVSRELSFMAMPGETLVTGSMVNNYVKQGVIPPPRKKRYTRRHVAALTFVCAFKRVFSIAQVKQVMESIYGSGADLALLYDEACELFERSLAACFAPGSRPDPSSELGLDLSALGEASLDPGLVRLIEASVTSLVTKVYVEQTLLVAGERVR